MNTITITRRDNGFVLSVDGGSIECGTTAEVWFGEECERAIRRERMK